MENTSQLLKERDEIIEGLVLSHMTTLSRLYDIMDRDMFVAVGSGVYDPFAAEYLSDLVCTNEFQLVLSEGQRNDLKKNITQEYLNGDRKLQIEKAMRRYAKLKRHKLVSDKSKGLL